MARLPPLALLSSGIESPLPSTVFLLSPANLSGKRGQMVLDPKSDFELARQLSSSAGAPLAAVFSFVSGLYFRGKVMYAERFGSAPEGLPSALVISAGGGLCRLDEPVTPARLRQWASVAVDDRNPHFTAPLQRHAAALFDERDAATRFVLLGSVASAKYSLPLREIFGQRLLFPAKFAGLGDMSRGSLMLRAARDGEELLYAPVR